MLSEYAFNNNNKYLVPFVFEILKFVLEHFISIVFDKNT